MYFHLCMYVYVGYACMHMCMCHNVCMGVCVSMHVCLFAVDLHRSLQRISSCLSDICISCSSRMCKLLKFADVLAYCFTHSWQAIFDTLQLCWICNHTTLYRKSKEFLRGVASSSRLLYLKSTRHMLHKCRQATWNPLYYCTFREVKAINLVEIH